MGATMEQRLERSLMTRRSPLVLSLPRISCSFDGAAARSCDVLGQSSLRRENRKTDPHEENQNSARKWRLYETLSQRNVAKTIALLNR
jgi:hypothetical protein